MSKKRGEYNIDVYCSGCRAQIFRYTKEGEGHLVKCYQSNVIRDYTDPENPLHCHECGSEFAREAMIHGRPAYKIIQGKIFVRR